MGWLGVIQKVVVSMGDMLLEQQFGDLDILVIVYCCVDYIMQCGLIFEGIYCKCGQILKMQWLLESLWQDVCFVYFKEGEQYVDDVFLVFKCFLCDLFDGFFICVQCLVWLEVLEIEDEEEKVFRY